MHNYEITIYVNIKWTFYKKEIMCILDTLVKYIYLL